MPSFADATQALLTGALSTRAQGFLLALPLGTTARTSMARALEAAYGTAAHPDVYVLETEGGGPAKVADVRRALTFSHTHPAGQGLKTLWVPQADAMTAQAANAFLKTLEEPSGSTRVILGASRPERLLATTRSRCITLSVRADLAFGQAELAERVPEAGAQDLETALALTDGAVDAAARLLGTKGGLDWAKGAQKAVLANTILPIPTGGVNGLDGACAGLVVQAALRQALRSGQEGVEKRIDAAAPYLGDLDRPGLDVPTRMRALARALQAA